MGLIFYASSMNGEQVPEIDIPGIDKLFHFIEYLILGFLLARALSRSSANVNYRHIFISAVLISSFYGLSDEFHQRFVPGRTCDIFDFLSDLIGSSIGAGLCVYKERIRSAVDKAV